MADGIEGQTHGLIGLGVGGGCTTFGDPLTFEGPVDGQEMGFNVDNKGCGAGERLTLQGRIYPGDQSIIMLGARLDLGLIQNGRTYEKAFEDYGNPSDFYQPADIIFAGSGEALDMQADDKMGFQSAQGSVSATIGWDIEGHEKTDNPVIHEVELGAGLSGQLHFNGADTLYRNEESSAYQEVQLKSGWGLPLDVTTGHYLRIPAADMPDGLKWLGVSDKGARWGLRPRLQWDPKKVGSTRWYDANSRSGGTEQSSSWNLSAAVVRSGSKRPQEGTNPEPVYGVTYRSADGELQKQKQDFIREYSAVLLAKGYRIESVQLTQRELNGDRSMHDFTSQYESAQLIMSDDGTLKIKNSGDKQVAAGSEIAGWGYAISLRRLDPTSTDGNLIDVDEHVGTFTLEGSVDTGHVQSHDDTIGSFADLGPWLQQKKNVSE
jgi:hypothetical protein